MLVLTESPKHHIKITKHFICTLQKTLGIYEVKRRFYFQLHGTYRRKDRIYTEDTFFGKGKALSEATETELKADIEERLSENPIAYRENKLVYKLTENDLKSAEKVLKENKKSN